MVRRSLSARFSMVAVVRHMCLVRRSRWVALAGLALPSVALAQTPPPSNGGSNAMTSGSAAVDPASPPQPTMAEELTANAREAATKGQCAGVVLIGDRIRELDADYFERVFVNGPAVAGCLRKQPDAPPPVADLDPEPKAL